MQSLRRALVAGGTGLVGSELLALLGADARYRNVTSLVRREVTARDGVENCVISFADLDRLALPEIDDAYCCLGTTRSTAGSDEAFRKVDLDYVLAYARAARRAGAVRFLLVSSLGADANSRFLYTRTKGQAEAGVSALGFDVVGIARPSFLVGQRAAARPAERAALVIARIISPLMVGPLRRFRPIVVSKVAAALIQLAFVAPQGVTVLSSEEIAVAADKNNSLRAESP